MLTALLIIMGISIVRAQSKVSSHKTPITRVHALKALDQGGFVLLANFKEDVNFAGGQLDFKIKHPDLDTLRNSAYNLALFELDEYGVITYAKRIEYSINLHAAFHEDRLYIVTTQYKDFRYQLLTYNLKGNLLSHKQFLTRLKDSFVLSNIAVGIDGGIVVQLVVEADDTNQILLHKQGRNDTLITTSAKYEKGFYLLHLDSMANVHQAYFTYSLEKVTAKSKNNRLNELHIHGDTVWLIDDNYIKPGIELSDGTIYEDVSYQGFVTRFVNGILQEHNLNVLPPLPNDPWQRKRETMVTGSLSFIDSTNRFLMATGRLGYSAFDMTDLTQVCYELNRNDYQDELVSMYYSLQDGLIQRSNGLLYGLNKLRQPAQAFQQFEVDDLLLSIYDPKNGKRVALEKIGSNFHHYWFNCLGKDNNNLLFLVNAYGYVPERGDHYEYITLGTKQWRNNNYFIVRINLRNTNPDDLVIEQEAACFDGKVVVKTSPLRDVDSIIVDWGDGTEEKYTNRHRLKHSYAKADEYFVKYRLVNESTVKKGIFSAKVPLLNRLYPNDSIGFLDSAWLNMPSMNGLSYRWEDGSTAAAFYVKKEGYLRYTATYDSCSYSDSIYAYQKPNSLNQLQQSAIHVWPNPANQQLMYRITSNLEENGQLYITDLQGRSCFSSVITSRNGSLNLSALKPGFYILKVHFNDGFSQKRLFIQR